MAKAILIKVDGREEVVEAKNGREFTLEELQGFVGGYIEIVPAADGRWSLVVDEEGRLKEKPVNNQASHLYGRDFVVGDALYIETKYLR